MTNPYTLPIITPHSATFILAYLHRHSCSWLPKQGTTPGHLQTMAAWLNAPMPRLRTIRNHPYLAAHLALLLATDLVKVADDRLTLQPEVSCWLFASPQEQIGRLLEPFTFLQCWEEHLGNLGWQEVLPIDSIAYWQQQLQRQMPLHLSPSPDITSGQNPVGLVISKETAGWYLSLPDDLPLSLLFDLLQIGEWLPNHCLACTPLTIANAVRQGMGYSYLAWLLETATQRPLAGHVKEQLADWTSRQGTYQVRNGYLLSTKQPEQLAQILANRSLRPYVQEQIGPRYALVHPEMLPSLERFLGRAGYPLDRPQTDTTTDGQPEDTENIWLAIRVLTGLRQIIPLPITPPHHTLAELAARLSPIQQTALEHQAQSILDQVRSAIRGTDAFLPTYQPTSKEFLHCIQEAIQAESTLEITYQSPADYESRYRCIQPLWVEQRGALHYLHAYCYRAEKNLVFRLDRIHSLQPGRQVT